MPERSDYQARSNAVTDQYVRRIAELQQKLRWGEGSLVRNTYR